MKERKEERKGQDEISIDTENEINYWNFIYQLGSRGYIEKGSIKAVPIHLDFFYGRDFPTIFHLY